jgi:hypothetical protein
MNLSQIVTGSEKHRDLLSNAELSRRLDELESKYDKQFRVVFDALRHLMAMPVRNRQRDSFSFALNEEVSYAFRSSICSGENRNLSNDGRGGQSGHVGVVLLVLIAGDNRAAIDVTANRHAALADGGHINACRFALL